MKTTKILFTLLAITFSLASCTSSDEPIDGALSSLVNSNTNNPTATNVAGTYLLTAFNTSVPTDLNNDGRASTNQMSETSCFNSSLLVLNTNGTFTSNNKGIDIDLTVTPNAITCFTDPNTTGTYTVNNNVLTTRYTENGVVYNDVFTISGNTLTSVLNNGTIVGLTAGNPVYLTSNITIIYTKI